MRYKIFGRHTGLRVAEIALGAGMFGTGHGHGAEPEEARKIFDGYAQAGGNFIDTADVYQAGQSEALVGDFIAADRDHFVLATKYTLGPDPKGGLSRTGNSRKNMIQSVEASLRRLKTDRIDLYWVHMADGVTPIEEIARGFDELVRAGKILYVGISDFPAWRVARAATLSELRGWAPIAGLQIEYSLSERTAERELLPMAEALGLGTALWSPLGGGFLTGKYRSGEEGRLTSGSSLIHREDGNQRSKTLDAVLAIAEEAGATAAQVAIAWLRDKAARSSTSLIPILGPRSRAQLDDTLGALKLTLADEWVRRLNEVSAVPLGVPHEFLAGEGTSNAIAGGKLELFDLPKTPVA
jgi:aryl-alcohol dehydrogenase-like predicted oxidoreductase